MGPLRRTCTRNRCRSLCGGMSGARVRDKMRDTHRVMRKQSWSALQEQTGVLGHSMQLSRASRGESCMAGN